MNTLRISTRASILALKQAHIVQDYLLEKGCDATLEIVPMTTTGDKHREWNLVEKGGKGLFIKELQESLLTGDTQLAVHSAKDLPTETVENLALAAFLPREDPRDVLIINADVLIPKIIATSSPRRKTQLMRLYPQAEFIEIRGNVDTRIRKIESGYADATVLAAAGLNRLDITASSKLRFETLTLEAMVPAVGQGAIVLESTTEYEPTLKQYTHTETHTAIIIERLFLKAIGGGCNVAFGAYFKDETLHIFHPKIGYHKTYFAVTSLEYMQVSIKNLVKELGINQKSN